MAMSPKERDEKRRAKAARLQEEDLRLKVRPGTKQALLELMEWAGIEEQGEAMTVMIHRLHELTRDEAVKLLTPPRHKIELSVNVVRKLDQFRLSRELRAPGLELGDDPDDTGLILVAERA
ncbi:hypothetical protein HMH05_03225 [Pseudomonas sp. SbB1]|uniref:Uncharacterized protein n=1 Tax=Pseudomonas putida (strain GB-1) TaxID=76869 RepID=B0KKP5_PSEPG|nr:MULTISPECIES: hypothetical protein [Pseudomonas]ABY99349.1 hypothetical protein PputGB1_3458 [Pseudomonas putida GB-1]MBP0706963.1 hypothetical protein [Pseudomonas sp. T34]MCK2186401.1 hypothetical protein [Pseudomonas sp. MB04B]MDD2083492.1 hypothetical protein [Pseudomonas putida]MDD2093606.1 hypothetical protein [Pseudomonas putida]